MFNLLGFVMVKPNIQLENALCDQNTSNQILQ